MNPKHEPAAPRSEVDDPLHDPLFEARIGVLIDVIIEEEKRDFHPGLESFEQRASKIRHEVSNQLHQFRKSYLNGYQAKV